MSFLLGIWTGLCSCYGFVVLTVNLEFFCIKVSWLRFVIPVTPVVGHSVYKNSAAAIQMAYPKLTWVDSA